MEDSQHFEEAQDDGEYDSFTTEDYDQCEDTYEPDVIINVCDAMYKIQKYCESYNIPIFNKPDALHIFWEYLY